MGDQVRVQNALTGRWSVKGTIGEVIEHDGGESKSYKVVSEEGAEYHRNGRFIKIRISKMKAQLRVRFEDGAWLGQGALVWVGAGARGWEIQARDYDIDIFVLLYVTANARDCERDISVLWLVTAMARDYERDILVLWLVNTQQGGWEISREQDRAEQSGEQ